MANFTVDLDDGDGFEWDIRNTGAILDGTDDAFDNAFDLSGFATVATQSIESMNGRQHETVGTHSSGLDVSRKIYVSETEGYARFFDTFTNNTGAAITFDLSYSHNAGADSA